MKNLVNGIALYDITSIDIKDAFQFAKDFFNQINIQPNSIYYFYQHAPDKDGETISTKDVSLDELAVGVENGIIDHFIIHYSSTARLWDIGLTFYSKYSKFGESINYLEMQFLDEFLKLDNHIIHDLLNKVATISNVVYGIGYQLNGSMAKAYHYALCLDGSTIFEYENSSDWLYQLPSRTDDKPQYVNKLRMVYPLNILNEKHLRQNVLDMALESWILENENNGKLISVNNKNKIWIVNSNELNRINNTLGEAGILISWEKIQPKPIKKLP